MKFERTYLTFLIAFILTACSNGNGQKTIRSANTTADSSPLRIDTTINLLKSKHTLIPIDLIRELNIIDKVYSYGSKGDAFCDTTVQLTNDIFYSIISLPDTFGLCSYYFVLTIDDKNKRAISSKYLEPACDIDFASDSYQLYDHFVIAKDTILLRETTIYQKENRESNDEEENIDRKEIKEQYFLIKPTGEITLTKTTPDK